MRNNAIVSQIQLKKRLFFASKVNFNEKNINSVIFAFYVSISSRAEYSSEKNYFGFIWTETGIYDGSTTE